MGCAKRVRFNKGLSSRFQISQSKAKKLYQKEEEEEIQLTN